jgi:hypothetical protein
LTTHQIDPITLEARLAALESQVHELRSVQEIQQLHHTYIRCLADRDWQGCVDCYAEDAVCDIRSHGIKQGRQEIAEMILGELAPMVKSHDAYMLTSPNISVAGNHATGEWTWHRFQCEFRTGVGWMRVWGPWSEGRYRCEYVREDGTWKFSKVWFRVLLPDSDEAIAQLGDGKVIGTQRS